jgi:hypothetical protein
MALLRRLEPALAGKARALGHDARGAGDRVGQVEVEDRAREGLARRRAADAGERRERRRAVSSGDLAYGGRCGCSA